MRKRARGTWLIVFLFSLALFYNYSRPSALPQAGDGFDLGLDKTKAMTVRWDDDSIPRTNVLAHYPGWTIFDRVYMLNGTFFIVTSHPDAIPERRMMISSGLSLGDVEANEPTDKHLRVVTPSEAKQLFGSYATRIKGVTFFQNESIQFLPHYFHFVVEVIFHGHWRVYSSLDTTIEDDGTTVLPYPERLILPRCNSSGWHDSAGFNEFFVHTAFPDIEILSKDDSGPHSAGSVPVIYDRLVLGDRPAWHRWDNIKDPNTKYPLALSRHWWAPVRKTVVEHSAGNRPITWGVSPKERPVITYISRQRTGRRLIEKDHEKLVEELQSMAKQHDYEFVVAYFEEMSKADQVHLSSRTTILLGVHGNGLSSQIWMKPNPRSAVFEIFIPNGFTLDYFSIAHSIGIRHYSIWDSKSITLPDVPSINFPEHFHSEKIPVDGKAIAQLIHKRLSLVD